MPNGNLRVAMRKSRCRCRCLAGLSDGVCVLNAVNRALKSPKWIFSSAPILCCPWHIHRRISSFKLEMTSSASNLRGVNTENCSRRPIPKVKKKFKFRVSLKALYPIYRMCLFRAISQWAFQAARSRINIFQSTMNHTWSECPKRRGPRFIPLGRWMKFIFLQRRGLFLACINRAAESGVAAVDGRS